MQWYPSKVDRWLAIVLAIAPIASLAAALGVFATDEPQRWIGLLPLVIIVLVYGGLVFPMRYGIDDDELIVRHGFVRQHIRLRDITQVEPTRNPLSSPALSLDRLLVTYGKRIMISPADKERFLAELAARAQLVRDGERLVRR